MPVQMVLRDGSDFRGLAGTITSGHITVGAPVHDALTGRVAHVRRILSMDRERRAAQNGEAVVVELDADLDIARGTVLGDPAHAPVPTRQLIARLVWLADAPLARTNGLLLQTPTDTIPVSSLTIKALLNLDTMVETPGDDCAANDIAVAAITLARPAVLENFADNRELGGFVLVDALSGATLAGGVVLNASGSATEQDRHAGDTGVFRLTAEMLERGVCAGLSRGSAEFRHRAEHVATILAAAGVRVEIADNAT